jgi:plastocyanin
LLEMRPMRTRRRMLLATASLFGLCMPSWAEENASGKWATIKGQVVLDAKAPEPAEIDVPANHLDRALCLKNGKIYEEEWVVNKKNNGLKNVFVWIKPDGAKPATPFPKNQINPQLLNPGKDIIEIDQPCCQFIPHSLAARAGQTLVIKNSAPASHNARYDTDNNGFANPALKTGEKHEIKDLKAERLPFTLSCTIHPWMKAHIGVFDHPYFALTDENGAFEIKDAPMGKFRLYVWHDSGWMGAAEGKSGTPIEIDKEKLDLPVIKFPLPKPRK